MREIRTTLLPNGEQQVQAGGDFVYVDYVDREIKLMIHDQVITVNPGDKVRPARPFKSVTVINPDDTNPVAVVLKVGEGDYNSQIIRGEVTVQSGIRKADGQWIDDSRADLPLRVNITGTDQRQFDQWELMKEFSVAGKTTSQVITLIAPDRLLLCPDSNSSGSLYSEVTGWPDNPVVTDRPEIYGRGQGFIIGSRLFLPDFSGGADRVIVYRIYSLVTHRALGSLTTEAPFVQNPNTPLLLCAACDGDVIYQAQKQTIFAINARTGAVMSSVTLATFPRSIVLHGGYVHVVDTQGQVVFLSKVGGLESVDTALATIPTYDSIYDGYPAWRQNSGAVYIPGTETMVVPRFVQNGVPIVLREFSAIDRDIRLFGKVSNCSGAGLFKSNNKDWGTNAVIGVDVLPTGQVLVEGEVIRAVLEIYLGRFVRPDYLDFVYQVVFENESGYAPRTVSSGGQSFKAANIEDSFSCEFPQKIKITLREGII
ncbi:hypothetical protein [Alcanivorax sp.]|uniref:hypothetical protein n=1 Tax=Alcanivorax sp. TaxID=1872427 RepID=UPI000C0FCF79|nr:hypothetical protein [Alcanivorax sp.]PHR67952.1 MAG: hypothetical protein COA55_03505 [Alcanivorax sp.]